MLKFRIKPSTSQPSHRRSKTPEPNAEEFFPFSNKKLKIHGWEEDSVSIRPFKSCNHISRKNYEFIPNLKNLKLENEKVSVVKSSRNEYNIFVKKTAGMVKSSAKNIDCINGVRNKEERGLFRNDKLMEFHTAYTSRTNNSFIYGNKYEKLADFASTYSGSTLMHISGEPKNISPSRSGPRGKQNSPEIRIIYQ